MKFPVVLSLVACLLLGSSFGQIRLKRGLDHDRLAGESSLHECSILIGSEDLLDSFFDVTTINASEIPLKRDLITLTESEKDELESEHTFELGECKPVCSAVLGDHLLWCIQHCQGSPRMCPTPFCSPDCTTAGVFDESICDSRTDDMSPEECSEICSANPSECPKECTTACIDPDPILDEDPISERGRCGPDFDNAPCNADFGECCSHAGWCGVSSAHCAPCEPGHYGPFCTECEDDCGEGWCRDGRWGDGGCTCNKGAAGKHCDECAFQHFGDTCAPCGCKGGVCDDGKDGSGKCFCFPAYMGAKCDVCKGDDEFGPDCETCDCPENSICNAGFYNDGKCTCIEGWSGRDCNQCAPGFYGPECKPCRVDCSGNGHCNDGVTGNGKCICDEGFTGPKCKKCEPNYFGNDCELCPACVHGECNDKETGDGKCDCDDGFGGTLCDDCSSSDAFGIDCEPCPDCGFQGECDAGYSGSGTCRCNANFLGDRCDECEYGFFGEECEACPECGPNGACEDGLEGSGSCRCFGDIDCGEHGHCHFNDDNEFSCACEEGWMGEKCEFRKIRRNDWRCGPHFSGDDFKAVCNVGECCDSFGFCRFSADECDGRSDDEVSEPVKGDEFPHFVQVSDFPTSGSSSNDLDLPLSIGDSFVPSDSICLVDDEFGGLAFRTDLKNCSSSDDSVDLEAFGFVMMTVKTDLQPIIELETTLKCDEEDIDSRVVTKAGQLQGFISYSGSLSQSTTSLAAIVDLPDADDGHVCMENVLLTKEWNACVAKDGTLESTNACLYSCNHAPYFCPPDLCSPSCRRRSHTYGTCDVNTAKLTKQCIRDCLRDPSSCADNDLCSPGCAPGSDLPCIADTEDAIEDCTDECIEHPYSSDDCAKSVCRKGCFVESLHWRFNLGSDVSSRSDACGQNWFGDAQIIQEGETVSVDDPIEGPDECSEEWMFGTVREGRGRDGVSVNLDMPAGRYAVRVYLTAASGDVSVEVNDDFSAEIDIDNITDDGIETVDVDVIVDENDSFIEVEIVTTAFVPDDDEFVQVAAVEIWTMLDHP